MPAGLNLSALSSRLLRIWRRRVSSPHTRGVTPGSISAATFVSRILGLARETVQAYVFGATAVTDAFWVAFRIPNLLRDLFAEGAMSSAFVPTLPICG